MATDVSDAKILRKILVKTFVTQYQINFIYIPLPTIGFFLIICDTGYT